MRIILILFLFTSPLGFSQDCDSIPEINKKIVKLAKKKTGKKVDRGECWDLAKYVLDETNAKWDDFEVYGDLINWKKECIKPGDIIQFEKIKLQWKEGNATYNEEMKHHTAVVYKVISKDLILVLHQNTAEHGRKVGSSKLRLDAIKKGKLYIYRPAESD
ncbi:MAG: CHAP domain-containing protein [Crocinitomicaceae bacterium]|nr:CHAP domain-containing protein [Crocinitomicaceae bacterium]